MRKIIFILSIILLVLYILSSKNLESQSIVIREQTVSDNVIIESTCSIRIEIFIGATTPVELMNSQYMLPLLLKTLTVKFIL